MILIHIFLLGGIGLALWFCAKKQDCSHLPKKEHPLRMLYPAAEGLIHFINRYRSNERLSKERQQYREIYIGAEPEKRALLEQTKRAALCIALGILMLLFSFLSTLSNATQTPWLQEGKLLRPARGTGADNVVLQWEGTKQNAGGDAVSGGAPAASGSASTNPGDRDGAYVSEGTLQGEVGLTLREQKFSGEELEALFQQAREYIESVLCKENNGLREIRGEVSFPETVPGTEVAVSIYPDSYQWLNPDGSRTAAQIPDEGVTQKLRVEMSYYEQKKEFEIELRLFPEPMTTERFLEQLEQSIKQAEEEGTGAVVPLPEELAGVSLEWSMKKEQKGIALVLLGGVAIFAILLSGQQTRNRQIKQREQQLIADYPELVSKFLLLLNAGLTTRAAWERIVADYQPSGRKRFVYEEMRLTWHALKNGESEARAYEQFGKRCRLLPYLRFCTVLVQNLKKGAKGTLPLLEQEATAAFAERKEAAKRLGEEAGTKLLAPMAGILGIILVMILVPAFQGI